MTSYNLFPPGLKHYTDKREKNRIKQMKIEERAVKNPQWSPSQPGVLILFRFT